MCPERLARGMLHRVMQRRETSSDDFGRARSGISPSQARGTSRRKNDWLCSEIFNSANAMIRKLTSGKYRLYSRKKDPKTGRRRNLGSFSTRAAAEKHERASNSTNGINIQSNWRTMAASAARTPKYMYCATKFCLTVY